MAAPQLLALNKLGEIRNSDSTLFQVIQEVQQQTNEYILRQAVAVLAGDVVGPPGANTVTRAAKADALSTTGAAVNVTAAAPPTVGQALVATSATTATWQAVAASGGVLFAQTADRVTTANAQSTLFGTGTGSLTLPANFFTVGRSIRITLGGFTSTAGGAGSKSVIVSLGGVQLCVGGASAIFATQQYGPYATSIVITCRTTGASGTAAGAGYFCLQNWTSPVDAYFGLGNGGFSTPVIDTTGTLAVDVQYQDGDATGRLTTVFATLEAL